MKVRIKESFGLSYKKDTDAVRFVERIKEFRKAQIRYHDISKEGKKEDVENLKKIIREENKAIANVIRMILKIDNLLLFRFDEEHDIIIVKLFEEHELLAVGSTYSLKEDEEGIYVELGE